MADALRTLSPLERVLYLGSIAWLKALPTASLVGLAERARERWFPRGANLITPGQPVSCMFILVEGSVAIHRDGRELTLMTPPDQAGVLAMISRVPGGVRAEARTPVLALEVSGHGLWDAFEDDFTLMHAALGHFSRQLVTVRGSLPIDRALASSPPAGTPPKGPMTLVDCLSALLASEPFGRCNVDTLVPLCRHMEEVSYLAGERIWASGEAPQWGLLVVSGTVGCGVGEQDGGVEVGAGFQLGLHDGLAGGRRSFGAVATRPVVGLRYDIGTLLSVAESNFHLAREILVSAVRPLLETYDAALR